MYTQNRVGSDDTKLQNYQTILRNKKTIEKKTRKLSTDMNLNLFDLYNSWMILAKKGKDRMLQFFHYFSKDGV